MLVCNKMRDLTPAHYTGMFKRLRSLGIAPHVQLLLVGCVNSFWMVPMSCYHMQHSHTLPSCMVARMKDGPITHCCEHSRTAVRLCT
jgi:hypothetical protein